jgi:hypothetical protein
LFLDETLSEDGGKKKTEDSRSGERGKRCETQFKSDSEIKVEFISRILALCQQLNIIQFLIVMGSGKLEKSENKFSCLLFVAKGKAGRTK